MLFIYMLHSQPHSLMFFTLYLMVRSKAKYNCIIIIHKGLKKSLAQDLRKINIILKCVEISFYDFMFKVKNYYLLKDIVFEISNGYDLAQYKTTKR